jgi:hypothetical protein
MTQLDIAASWVLTYALHSVALGILALLGAWPLRRYAALRCVIWRTALFAAPFTSGIAVARSSEGATTALSATDSIRGIVPARFAVRVVVVEVREIAGSAPRRVEKVTDPLRTALASIVILVFAVTGLTGGTRYATRRLRVLRTVRSCLDADTGAVLNPAIRVVAMPGLGIPVALIGRIIAIPPDFESSGTPSQRQAILLHEAAHVERRDPAWIDAARLMCAIAPWQRLNCLILDRLERDSELAADTRAVGHGADARALVAGLARFASRAEVPAASGAALIRADSPLVHRARQLLDGGQKAASPGVVACAACLSIIVLALLMTAPASTTAAGAIHRPAAGSPSGIADVREVDIIRRQPAN